MTSKAETVFRNLQAVARELFSLGYAFDEVQTPQPVDWALELRLSRAMRHARQGMVAEARNPSAILSEPALQWVKEEEIVLPRRFAPHPQALLAISRDAHAATRISEFELSSGIRLAESVREWFTRCGSVDFNGSHPFLNPGGHRKALRIASFERCVKSFDPPWLPLWPAESRENRLEEEFTRVHIASGFLSDGRDMLDAIQDTLWWAGIPSLATEADPPIRELEYIRARLVAAA